MRVLRVRLDRDRAKKAFGSIGRQTPAPSLTSFNYSRVHVLNVSGLEERTQSSLATLRRRAEIQAPSYLIAQYRAITTRSVSYLVPSKFSNAHIPLLCFTPYGSLEPHHPAHSHLGTHNT